MSDQVKICRHGEDVLELRVHGAGDTPLEDLLGKGEYELKRGDGTAGFYRRAGFDGLEAYSWGKFTYRQKSRAFWVLLSPFTLANLSGWLVFKGRWERLAQQTIRIMAVGLTLMFVLWMGIIAVDTAALQCGGQEICADRQVWLRFFTTDFFADHPARRLAVGLLVPALLTWLLVVFAGWRSADAYERYQGQDEPRKDDPKKDDPKKDERKEGEAHPLACSGMWRTFHRVRGLALLHAAAALSATAAAGGFGLWRISRGARLGFVRGFLPEWSLEHVLVYAALAILVVAVLRVALVPPPDEAPKAARDGWIRSEATDSWVWAWSLVALGSLAVLAVVLRGILATHEGGNTFDGYFGFSRMALTLGTIALLFLVPLLILSWRSRRPGAAYYGFGPFVAMALGVLVASALVTGAVQWSADLLGEPVDQVPRASAVVEAVSELGGSVQGISAQCLSDPDQIMCQEQEQLVVEAADNFLATLDAVREPPITIPVGFDLFSVTLVLALVVVGLYVAWLEFWLLRRRLVPWDLCPPNTSHCNQIGQARAGRSTREFRRWRKGVARDMRASPRNTRIHGAAVWLLILVGVPAMVLFPEFFFFGGDWVDGIDDWLNGSGVLLLSASRWVVAAAVVISGVYIQRSYSDPARRRALGGVWDVATFWPRAYHPFAAPTYSARAVPELRSRIEELLADPNQRLVVSSHSQGVPLTMAVLAQLDTDKLNRIAFLSYGSPTGSLYGHFFPTYYGPDQIKKTGDLLKDRDVGNGKVRWRNIWRITDWTGGYAFPPPRRDLVATANSLKGIDYADDEAGVMAREVEVLWCDPHHNAPVVPGDPLPPSVGHHTYLTDPGYPTVCEALAKTLEPTSNGTSHQERR